MIRLALLLSLLCWANFAKTIKLSMAKTTGEVSFLAIGRPSAIKIKGKAPAGVSTSGELRFSDKTVSGTVIVNLSAFETGIELRDRHMKERYLEVARFPEAALEIEALVLPESLDKGDVMVRDVAFHGQLSLHGQKRPVSGTAGVEESAQTNRITFTITFSTKTSDYAISVPSYMGIKVADEVIVSAVVSGPIEVVP